jgi:predicted flavoprotein YhiN
VSVFDAKRSVGRKLLVAGYGGLNITHGEDLETFVTRYSGPGLPAEHFAKIIRAFSPDDLRQWASQLGIETFEQRTGRVDPKEMKAAPLLRRWIECIKLRVWPRSRFGGCRCPRR